MCKVHRRDLVTITTVRGAHAFGIPPIVVLTQPTFSGKRKLVLIFGGGGGGGAGQFFWLPDLFSKGDTL